MAWVGTVSSRIDQEYAQGCKPSNTFMSFTPNIEENSEDAHASPLVFPHMFVVHKLGPLFNGPLKYGKSPPRPKHFLIRFEYTPSGH